MDLRDNRGPHIGGTIETVPRFQMVCYICKVQGEDLYENKADALTALSMHNQIAKHELGYQQTKCRIEGERHGLSWPCTFDSGHPGLHSWQIDMSSTAASARAARARAND